MKSPRVRAAQHDVFKIDESARFRLHGLSLHTSHAVLSTWTVFDIDGVEQRCHPWEQVRVAARTVIAVTERDVTLVR